MLRAPPDESLVVTLSSVTTWQANARHSIQSPSRQMQLSASKLFYDFYANTLQKTLKSHSDTGKFTLPAHMSLLWNRATLQLARPYEVALQGGSSRRSSDPQMLEPSTPVFSVPHGSLLQSTSTKTDRDNFTLTDRVQYLSIT